MASDHRVRHLVGRGGPDLRRRECDLGVALADVDVRKPLEALPHRRHLPQRMIVGHDEYQLVARQVSEGEVRDRAQEDADAELHVATRDRLDIFGCAETGSGKTLAYVLPMLQRVLSEREAWDLFPGRDPSAPVLAFIHGGYWQWNRRQDFACVAEGALAMGWGVALCGYTLAPEATLTRIVWQVHAALDWLSAHGAGHGMGGPVVLSGWSAGGHWSNWTLVNTDRFKAISSGAGTSNWISMYAQSDVQRNRQFYLGDKLPYEDFDAYWDQSPIKYISKAKTPTMIHVVDGDPRVPSPQSVELHMALKKLGVPTELFMYPGDTHGIPDPRNRLVKAVSEMAWMDYYVRGQGEKFQWRDVLKTVETETAGAATDRDGN
jgi:acetyl esterase/lipase